MARSFAAAAHSAEVADIAIITILPEEYEAIRKRLRNLKRDLGTEEQPNQYAWMLGEIESAEGGRYQVVLAMAGSPGNTSGSLATSKTIARWQPRYVLLVGIAGGMDREGLTLGDVVVSSIIRAYEYGKIQEGHFEPRPDFQYRVDGSLHRGALSLKEGDWQQGLGRQPGGASARPKVLAGPIASGDKVVDDVGSDFFAAVAKSFPKLLAVEMEGAGAAAAIDAAQDEGRSVGFLMIRSISDMPPTASSEQRTSIRRAAGGTKARDNWKQYASNAAASFAVHLVSHAWPVPPRARGTAKHLDAVNKSEIEAVRTRYFRYLEAECGELQLDGLPADEELGSRRLELEKLFVPLHVVRYQLEENKDTPGVDIVKAYGRARRPPSSDEREQEERLFFGELLTKTSRIALLAPPGGGKSTMLKRLALAYAFPERRQSLDDRLPERRWLPLLLRCRELKARATEPFNVILAALAERAEMKSQQETFLALVDTALADRSLLLLVDGLDEITDEGERSAFVQQLHTFLELHPDVSLVVTSREAGFRLVASTVAKQCASFLLAEFDDEDITRLTVAWHREVLGNRPQVIKDAEKLAENICQTDRVRRLACNPLLLMTLLLVKRWVGELPQRRAALYQKAIEVLLMSWNAAAHEKLETSEALPQLGFLAFSMMKASLQQISERRLRAILMEARQQMEDVYAYARIGVDEFIRRVEHRSSLLVQSGHTFEEGRMWPLYEFRHLTFQEYLAAHAVAEGHYPDRQESDTVLGVLQPHLDEPSWKEVIPLAAVLAARNAKPLIEHLTDLCQRECRHSEAKRKNKWPFWNDRQTNPASLLAQCLIDEVPILPALAERAILALTRAHISFKVPVDRLASGRYRELIERTLKTELEANVIDFEAVASSAGIVGRSLLLEATPQDIKGGGVERIKQQLRSGLPVDQAIAALTLMELAYRNEVLPQIHSKAVDGLLGDLEQLLQAPQHFLHGSAAWACAMLGKDFITPALTKRILPRLFELWTHGATQEIQILAAWSIEKLPLLKREATPLPPPTTAQLKWLVQQEARILGAVAVVAFYWRQPWSDGELLSRIEQPNFSEVYSEVYKALVAALSLNDRAKHKKNKRRNVKVGSTPQR